MSVEASRTPSSEAGSATRDVSGAMVPTFGVNCAVATPLNADLSPDFGRLGAHCRYLLDEGCHGIALLGTTGEANSFSVGERREMLEAVLEAGVPPERLLPGTGVAAGPETVELTRHALANGVTRVVMLPPFYYKGVTDDGLFAAYARIVEAVGDDRLRIILYHIPQTSNVPLSRDLVARLANAFPGTIIGIKDSSGEFDNMRAIAAANPGFAVLAGADPLLLPLLRTGGAGCITAAANLIPGLLRFVYDNHADAARAAEVEAVQAKITAWRALTQTYMQLPTVKALLAIRTGDAGWQRLRPPLMPVGDDELAVLRKKVAALA